MENASKALLIAGAILIAILLISLGIMVFNQGNDIANNSGLTQTQIQIHNAKFIKYEGDNVSGSRVKDLIQQVIVNNTDETIKDAGRKIKIKCTIDSKTYERRGWDCT